MTFYGEEKIPEEAGSHAHESPYSMTVPLVILALGSLIVGALLEWSHGLDDLLARTPSLVFLSGHAYDAAAAEKLHISIAMKSTVLVLIGLLFTALLYTRIAAVDSGKDHGSFGFGRTVPTFIRQILLRSVIHCTCRMAFGDICPFLCLVRS